MNTDRRALMAERDKALATGDIAKFQELTVRIAALPMKGIPDLTARDIQKYVSRKRTA
jgi:hypothetical protein